jgi:hypothetical protein
MRDGGTAVTRARGGPRLYLFVALAVALALGGGTAYALGGVQSFAAYQQANARYQTACDSLISWEPPSEILTGFYPNQRRLVTVRYRSQAAQALSISVSVPNLTQSQEFEAHAGPVTQSQDYWPPVVSSQALDALIGPQKRDGRILLTLKRADGSECSLSATVTLYSRQMMRWADQAGQDNAPYLAGWVTPQANVIRDLVGRAASQISQFPSEYAQVSALVGYDEGRAQPGAVVAQVNALFDTLRQAYHLRYAQVNVPFRQDAMQLIQLPRDVLTGVAPTAMCVESTVIMASAVERLGMRPYVVFTPGHVFLGVATDDHAGAIEYWETSDLNGATGAQANVHGDTEFDQASQAGNILYSLDIEAARAQGILPLE